MVQLNDGPMSLGPVLDSVLKRRAPPLTRKCLATDCPR